MKIVKSLRLKIQLGYLILLIPLLISVVISYMSLNSTWKKILTLESIDFFTQTLLDVRRHEKNYFLYHKSEELDLAIEQIKQVISILENNKKEFLKIDKKLVEQLERKSVLYLSALIDLEMHQQNVYAVEYIRALGHDLIEISKRLRQKEVLTLNSIFEKMMVVLFFMALISIGVMSGVGYFLSRSIVSPLEYLERSMKNFAHGKNSFPQFPQVKDKEIIAVFNALNIMLKELEARNEQLVQSKKLASLGTLLSGVAHELNNPLSNASSTCQIILEDLDTFDKRTLRILVRQIDNEIWRARDIIKTILEFSRNKYYDLRLWILRELVEEVLFMLRNKISENVRIHIYIPNDLQIYVDKQRFQQVILNLLSNAIDAIHGDGDILIKACKDDDRHGVFIAIEDNGEGIPEDVIDKIFDPFFSTKGSKGSGLGLYLVSEIVARHGGTIEVESVKGQGTTFFLFFPYKRDINFKSKGEKKTCPLKRQFYHQKEEY